MKTAKTYQRGKDQNDTEDLPGYPEHPRDEDIYYNAREENEIDPENIYSMKENVTDTASIEDDLDIPGSELDDDLEEIGNEDEENNYYSLSDNDDLEDLI